ncbi:GA module-containing protein [Streptococcus suis]|uniref:Rib/alpha-like domain-containing protein n=1 Tax=Streptococcus suis TaxID=1307 RepID=UPI002AAAD5B8|nr:Rib/alpha-like domain-containing protein [Streptococcus suis]QZT29702.1 GA module-containing protein [Streptococcus suis]
MHKFKRKKLNRQEAFNFEKRSQFSIRKLTIGVVSLAIGISTVLTDAPIVEAGTDYTPGVDIRYARNGSPKDLSTQKDFDITTTPYYDSATKKHYVDVTLTFNNEGTSYPNITFLAFNIPDSLYDPQQITRETYLNNGATQVLYQTDKFSAWEWADPADAGTSHWNTPAVWMDARFVAGRPDLLTDNGQSHVKWISATQKTAWAGWQYNGDKWQGDWGRLLETFNTSGDGAAAEIAVHRDFKDKSRTFYINKLPASSNKVVYKFRSEVKDGNKPMNFIYGMNAQIANGYANFYAKYGTTPDIRTMAEKYEPKLPSRTQVDDLGQITNEQKQQKTQAIKEANPDVKDSIKEIKYPTGDTGKVEIIYTDDAKDSYDLSAFFYPKPATTQGGTGTFTSTQTSLSYNSSDHTAETENGNRNKVIFSPNEQTKNTMHRIQLPDKVEVPDASNIEESKWNQQLNALKIKNNLKRSNDGGRSGTLAKGTVIFGYGSRYDNDVATDDMVVASETDARLKREGNKIVGIEVLGKNQSGQTGQVAGVITADMLFKKAEAKTDLTPLKESAKTEIDKLILEPEDKQNFKNAVQDAQDANAIEQALTNAKNKADELKQKKATAKAEIDKFANLTEEEKTQFKQGIDDLTTTNAIDGKVAEAKAQDLNKFKETAKEKLKDFTNLTPDQKTQYTNEIANADSADAIKTALDKAAFDDIKTKAVADINGMDPAPANKEDLLNQINAITKDTSVSDSKTPAEQIKSIVDKAKADAAKDAVKRTIDAIQGLTDPQKQDYKNEIDVATTEGDINNIIQDAQAQPKKNDTKNKISALTNLNNAQKDDLKAAVDNSNSVEELDGILATAYNLDADMKHLKDLVAQAEETKNSNLYTSVTQDKQTALDNAIVAAKKVTEQNTLGNVPTLTNDLTLALKGLNASPVTKDLDKKGLEQAIADAEAAKNDANPLYKYASEDKKQAFEQDLAAAKVAKENTSSKQTQADVDNALTNLITAKAGLNGKAPVKVQDVTPPLLVDAELNAKYSEVAFHGMSTVGRKVARPRTSTTEDLYGKDTTGLVELKVTNDGSPVDLTSVQFDDDSQAKLRTLGLQYVPYTEDEAQTRTNNAIGYFTTIEEAGVVKDTGTEIVELKFSLANKDGVRSSLQTFKYLVKDDIAPTADVTEHILIKGEAYTIDVPIQDNSLFGTEGGVSKGTISIKPTDNSGPLTPSILGVTNGTTANAFTITPTKPTQFILGNDNRGQRSNTGKVSFSGTPTETLEQTTYKFRLGDDNKLRNSPENVSLTDITFTVVDRLVAPAESAKVSVNNASSLTDTEKNAIKQAVKDANPHIAVIDGYAGNDASKQVRIDVTNTGQVTVTYPHGGKTDTLTADQVLKANEGPVFGTSDLLPTRWVTGANIQRHELPTLLVFSGPEKNQPAPAFPTDRQSLTVEQVTNNKFGRMPFTDPEGDALTFESIKTLSNGTIGINVAPNGTLHGNGIGNYGPGASWIVNLTATDSKGKATKSSDFRVVGYTDKVADPNQAVAGTYGQAVEEAQIFEKLTIDATSAYADNFKKTNDPNYKFEVPADQYTRTITGHSTTNDGQNVTTVNNGAAGLPTQGTYFAEVTTTNVWGQVIKNYVKVVYPELTTTIDPQAPTSPVTLQGETVQESEKPRIIQALKDANPNITFPERTDFQVAGDGTVTIVYPDQSRDTVRVPIKQQDSAKYTPTVTETPINSVTTPGTPLTEEERNAVKAAVRVTNFPEGGQQPTVTVPENAQVTTGTSGNTGKQVVVVTVNYPDGSSENVEVPVKQRDNAKYEATVSNPDTPAAIKASHALGTAITDQADKAAILAKVTVPAGSNGQPTLDQTPVVEIHDGKPAVKVTVTYPDQTADTVYVPVDQKDNEATEPTVTEPNKPALISQPATAATTLDKLTEEDKTAIKDKVEVPGLSGQDAPRKEVVSGVKDGSGQNADKKVVEVEVTYKDGTKDKVEVPVAQKDSAQYDATAKETPVALDTLLTSDQPLSAEDREALKAGVNVPEGSNGEIHVPEDAKVKQVAGKPVVEAEVHYPDGTVDKVQVPVRQSDRAVYTPNLVESKEVPISVDPAGNPSITSPDDAAILANVDVPAATQDGTKPQVTKTIASAVKDGTGANQGKKVVAVEITYPDQSKEMIEVPVKHADNQVHNPTAPTAAVKVDAPVTPDSPLSADDKKAIKDAVTIPDGSNGVASLPEDAKVVDRNGTPVVPVTVTYPDKTTDTVYVPVVQKDSAKHTPSLTNADSPVLIDTPAKTNEPVQEVDKTAIAGKVDKTNLPQDTEVKVPDNAVVEIVDGKPVVPVEITYPDGTSETINVPVKQADNLANDPSLRDTNSVPVLTEAAVGLSVSDKADKEAIEAKVDLSKLPEGTKATVDNPTIVAGKEDGPHAGQPVVNVLVTYLDGTQDTVEVPVKQADNVVKEPGLKDQTSVPIQAAAATGTVVPEADKQAILAKVEVPEGAKATIADDAKVVRENGEPVVPVTVTYPDGTQDTIHVPVKRADNSKYTPEQVTESVQVDATVTDGSPITSQVDKDAIIASVKVPTVAQGDQAPTVTLPANPTVKVKEDQPVVEATITYADGTTDTVDVPVVQKESAQKEPSLKKAEDGNPEKAIVSVEPKAGTSITEQADKDAILDKVLAPEGATASLGQSPTVIVVEDQPYVPVFVTYGDGSVDTINVPVKQADNQAYEPSLKTSAVTLTDIPRVGDKVEEEADLVAIKDAVETNGGTATIDNPVIVETADGQPAVEVVVTYEDGTKDTIQVPVRSGDNRLYTPSLKSESPVLISVSTEEGTALPGADQAKILANIDVPGINGGEKPEVELTIANPNVEHKNGKAGVTGTVTYKDGTTDTIFVPVATDTDKDGFSDQEEDGKGSDKNNPADVPSGETSAQRLDPIVKEAVPVSDPAKLTDIEKEAIKEEVKTSNDLPAGTEITVSDNGTVTVTYPDQSTDTIPANTTVTAKDTDGDGFSDKDEAAAGSDINDKASTPETLDDDKDGFTNKEETAAGTDAKDPASTPAGQDTAGRLTPAVESPVQVTDPAKLTDEEKEAVKKAVEDSNNLPAGTEIKVSDDGTVTVTYPDKSTDTIKPSETVKATETEAPSKPAIATTEKGDVLITPPAENVTNLDITFTPEGSAQPITVTVTKGEDGKWTAPADSGLVVNPDGSITIPADRVKDGSAVSVVAKNGDSLAIEVATTVVPTASTNADEKPVAPTKPGVTVTPEGEVLITPPAENVTSLDITFTPEGSTQPITVTVTKDEAGTWTAPAGSGLVVNQDGTITIPADIAKDGSSVSVVAKNGDLASDQVGSTVVPVQSTEVPVIPSKPTVTANGDGSVTVTPPAENVTSLDITFIPEGSDTPVRVPITKGEDGTWIAPADSSLVVNPDGSITIPADKLKDGTEGQVTAVAKNDQATSEDTPETPAVAPLAPTVETATDGSVRITPPTENVTSLDITFTPEGSDQPVTVTVTKDAAGNWTAPADSGLVVNSDGSITIPADRVKDGSVVSVVAKNGEVPSAEAGASYVPSTSTAVTPETPVAPAVPTVPTVSVDSNGNVLIIPPADGATSIDITFTPKDNAQPITVSITKGEDGKWLAPEGSIPVVNPDGTITISVSEIESGTAVSVISKNGEVPSTEAGSVLIPKATISDRLTPSVASPVKVTDPAKLTNEEKEAVKKAVEGSNNLPAGTKVEVSDNGTVTVTYPDGSVDTILPTKTVMESQHGAGETHELPAYDLQADDDKDGFSNLDELLAGTDPTAPASTPAGQDTAGRLTPGLAEPVEVKNPAKLTDTEKEAIKEEVKTSNDLPAGTEITVSDNGTVTVTYPDQSTDTIPANTTVTAKDTDGDGFSDKDEAAAGSDINDKASTPETLDDDKDGFTNKEETAAGTDAKDPASTPAGQDTAGRLTPAVESPVQVTDPAKLTDEEKEAVKKAVEDSNNLPAGTEIKVSDDGTVTVTYPDGSVDTIVAKDAVRIKVVPDTTNQPSGSATAGSTSRSVLPSGGASSVGGKKGILPNTGEQASLSTLAGLLTLAGLGLVAMKRRKEEKE